MPVITLNGQIGAGGQEVGPRIAQALGLDYVDRLILAEASRRVGATVSALAEKEARPTRLMERLAWAIQRTLERSALMGTGGDPFLGPSLDPLLSQPYPEGTHEPATRSQEVDDRRFHTVVSEVIREVARAGNVVILGRASNLVLRDHPEALHVGLVAPREDRARRLAQREGIPLGEAERRVGEQEQARQAYFRRFFRVPADDPLLYDLVLNTARLTLDEVVETVVEVARRRWPSLR